jgi:hypothetical protein
MEAEKNEVSSKPNQEAPTICAPQIHMGDDRAGGDRKWISVELGGFAASLRR